MDTNSNVYTFIYSSILVVIVAILLAFTAVQLQPLQEKNIRIERMQNILKSVGIIATVENAEQLFKDKVKDDFIVDLAGNKKTGKGFDVKMKTQSKISLKIMKLNQKLLKASGKDKEALSTKISKLQNTLELPVFILENEGKSYTVIPLRGKGLWGPIWGYVALEKDKSTIFGAVFDHKGETPGLGADIAKEWFQKQFKGKQLFEGKDLVSITVYKGGKGAAANKGDLTHGVDAISGGTITSKGLESMFKSSWLFNYKSYLKK